MEALVKERSIQRRLFTTNLKALDAMIEAGKGSELEIKTQHIKTYEIYKRVEELDLSIKSELMKHVDFNEEDFERELIACLQYKENWIKLNTKMEMISINNSNETVKKDESKMSLKRNYKLPEIKQKKFNGEIKNWLTFWGQFKKIDLDEDIDDDDKFLLLLQSIEENTEVYNLVESYPPNGKSYKSCIKELQSRYGREELLIEVYIRDILKLVLLHEKCELLELYDKLNANLRALKSLGISNCAAFVLPLVESALPIDILRLWERNKLIKKFETVKNQDDILEQLMEFMKSEIESLQRIKITENSFRDLKVNNEPTASCFMTQSTSHSTSRLCIWCEKDSHSSVECFKLSNMSIEDRKEHLKKINACFICLKKNHNCKQCRSYIKCYICGRRHTVAMCPGKIETEQEKKEEITQKKENMTTTTTNLSSYGKTTLLQTCMVKLRSNNKTIIVRALYDNGSQKTYIKEETAKKLGIEKSGVENLRQCLFGGVLTDGRKYNVYKVFVENLDGNKGLEVEALGQETICGHLDKLVLTKNISTALKNFDISISDLEYDNEEIELLIGADYSGLLMTSNIIKLDDSLIAIYTKLGWTIQGKQVGQRSTSACVMSMFCKTDVNLSDIWTFESLGIHDPAELKSKSQKEAECLAMFEETVKREEDGRYQVHLLFKVGHEDLLPNYERAKHRLDSTTRKIKSSGKFVQYDAVFKEWLSLQIIETVPFTNDVLSSGHFLPHKPVIKESSLTSKIRPVFDASQTDKNGLSLNNCLDKGLNFIDNIPSLLIGFRKNSIGITADIAKAFLQISLPPEDREYLKFLWWEDNSLQQVTIYRHCRLVFGLTCSPFLLAATLKSHLDKVTGEYKETAQILEKSFYVDNCLTSLNTEAETHKFIQEAKEIMKTAQFDLRMWVTSPMQINETGQQIVSVLGLNWDTINDELSCNTSAMPPLSTLDKISKRTVLSLTQKIFDPIGLTCPVTLPPKLILQETWRRGLTWDDALPEDMATEFKKWFLELGGLAIQRLQCKTAD